MKNKLIVINIHVKRVALITSLYDSFDLVNQGFNDDEMYEPNIQIQFFDSSSSCTVKFHLR